MFENEHLLYNSGTDLVGSKCYGYAK